MTETMEGRHTVLASRYALERQIGQGAMADVYLAHDIRHERKVAIKVLRPELTAHLGRDRFVQEIRVTANLQHPNILPLYDSGAADELLYYVMPFVEGESLRGRLARERQLGVEETIAIARDVAAALDYAHEHGIVHRDIKPENILLQRGRALVADFGIALAVQESADPRITEVGVTIGTPHYMSPEQAAGDRLVDARSDIYSLGAITYEMLTGEPPHQASTVQGVIAKIVSLRPAPIAQSRDLVPANVDAAVRRALANSPADRFTRASQFAAALLDPGYRLPVTGETATGRRPRALPGSRAARGFGAVLLAVGLVVGWGGDRLRTRRAPPPREPAAVFYLPLDSGAAIPGYPAMSPDGTMLAYPAGDRGSNRLYLRRLAEPTPTPIPQTEGAHDAFFSADGAWVGFVADQALKRVRLEDGSDAVVVPYLDAIAGATWREDDTIVFATLPKGSLFTVPASGGIPAPLIVAGAPRDSGYFFPHALPGGRALLFNTQSTGGDVGVLDLRTGARRLLGPGLRPSYVASGQLVYANPQGRLVAQPFDLGRLAPAGEATALSDELGVGRGRAFYSVSRTGTLAIIRAAGSYLDLVLLDRAGHQQVLFRNGGFWSPRYSPDGGRIVYGEKNPDDLWIYDVAAETRQRLTLDGAANNDAAWSPDGRQIAFATDRLSRKDIFVRDVTGGGTRPLVVREGLQWPSDWTASGYVVFTDVPQDEDRDIWTVKADGSAPARAWLETPAQEKAASVSPDGRWIAYDSNAPGRFEVFVNRFPDPARRPLRVSATGGRAPRWARDGRALYYWSDDRLVEARLELAGAPRVLRRDTVLRASYASADHANYDVHPDGQRFVVVTGRARPQRIVVAINPFAAMGRK